MERTLLAPPLQSHVDTSSEAYQQNRADMLEQLDVIDELLVEAEGGGRRGFDCQNAKPRQDAGPRACRQCPRP